MNNTTIVYEIPAPAINDNLVEWPSAFFALLCMALNSITQPSGRICELPYSLRFLARSSPVFCLVDSLTVLILWIRHMIWHLESPSRAASRIARSRFSDIEGETDDNLTSLERNFAFRCAVFGFGVLPQAIKIFACQGIRFVQAVAAVYLISWAIVELLMLFAGRGTDVEYTLPTTNAGESRKRAERREYYVAASVFLHALAYNFGNLLDPNDPNMDGEHKAVGVWFMRMWMLQFALIMWAEVIRIELEPDHDWQDWTLGVGFIHAFMIIAVTFVLCMSALGLNAGDTIKDWDQNHSRLSTTIAVVVSGVIPLAVSLVPVSSLWITSVAFPIAWFLVSYDSQGTYKPKWTEYLG
ncbi:hypothetical protein K491DRAFT_694901 [Lophiostoma macrostomum CBS 122681]|uniref:Uncharacterized protein n=1 Tax=Lophiostoma macrostomum CBS 122681 TaxID=1314788 RepID=A0A6A6T302_9PLEO|nr:hypothetical protein K491DRAFT_694901 [Lophiostoma macrostomum CBS 122681]